MKDNVGRVRAIIIIFIFSSNYLMANHHWVVSAEYTHGFETRDLNLWTSEIKKISANGVLLSTNFHYDLSSKVNIYGGLGTRAYRVKGVAGSFRYSGNVLKLLMLLGFQFNLSEKHTIGLGLQTENNENFNNFRLQNSDLLRYSTKLQYNYNLTEAFGLTAGITNAFYPLHDAYLIENPSNYLSVGINYTLK